MMLPRCALSIVLVFFTGCSNVPALPSLPSLTPYRMDIQQGNVVTQEMLAKLKPGMTPSQVRFILGTPLVVDAFHKDRWDYVYSFSKAGTLKEYRRIVVVFRDEKLARLEGDVTPLQPEPGAARPPAEPAAGAAAAPRAEPPQPGPQPATAPAAPPAAGLPAPPQAQDVPAPANAAPGEPTPGGAGAEPPAAGSGESNAKP